MNRAIQVAQIVPKIIAVGAVGFVRNRDRHDRPIQFAENSHRSRHGQGSGNQQPGLTQPRLHHDFGEKNILIGVAGTAFKSDPGRIQPLLGKKLPGHIRLIEVACPGAQQTRTAAENQPRIRI